MCSCCGLAGAACRLLLPPLSPGLQVVQLDYVKTFTAKQHEMGIFGAVGEIGVHHGKFLIPIVGNALVEEPAVALDLFEDQAANIDTSGTPKLGYDSNMNGACVHLYHGWVPSQVCVDTGDEFMMPVVMPS